MFVVSDFVSGCGMVFVVVLESITGTCTRTYVQGNGSGRKVNGRQGRTETTPFQHHARNSASSSSDEYIF